MAWHYVHIWTENKLSHSSCLLVTANDLIGSTISCINDNVPGNVLNTYCWIMSTFSIPCKFSLIFHLVANFSLLAKNKGIQGQDFPHQGIGPETDDDGDRVCYWFSSLSLGELQHYFWSGGPRLLSVGPIHAVPPGCHVLRAPLPVEDVRRQEDAEDHIRTAWEDIQYRW